MPARDLNAQFDEITTGWQQIPCLLKDRGRSGKGFTEVITEQLADLHEQMYRDHFTFGGGDG
jgi:hypothetical protein